MKAKLRSWSQQDQQHPVVVWLRWLRQKILPIFRWLRQKIRRHPFIATGVIIVLFALIIISFVVSKFGWDWTGFRGGESKVTTTMITPGTTVATEQQPAKTLWDWLGVLGILAIPVVVALGAAWFTAKQAEESDAENTDNQREAALRAYIDKMSGLLLKKKLDESNPDAEAQKIARVRTLTLVRSLDGARKASLLLFLYESGLIRKDIHDGIIDLRGADFSQADLRIANLSKDPLEGTTKVSKTWLKNHGLYGNLHNVKLSGVTLRGAKLTKANLNDADLSTTYLSEADLHDADLIGADLQGARLRKTILEDANLINADLSDAYLHYADLRNAKLSGAKLRGASLEGANLEGANLSQADLGGANLSRAKLRGTNLKGAKYNTKPIPENDEQGKPVTDEQGNPVMMKPTQWPQGFMLDTAGTICIDC
jgi:hypothetical protein